jgi:hypothetical protein
MLGVVQGCGGFRFAQEALLGFFVVEQMFCQELQRDRALQLCVLGLVDDAHAALAELLDDLVVTDGGADVQDRGIVALRES